MKSTIRSIVLCASILRAFNVAAASANEDELKLNNLGIFYPDELGSCPDAKPGESFVNFSIDGVKQQLCVPNKVIEDEVAYSVLQVILQNSETFSLEGDDSNSAMAVAEAYKTYVDYQKDNKLNLADGTVVEFKNDQGYRPFMKNDEVLLFKNVTRKDWVLCTNRTPHQVRIIEETKEPVFRKSIFGKTPGSLMGQDICTGSFIISR